MTEAPAPPAPPRTAIILAAGNGERLSREATVKPLLRVGGLTLIERTLLTLRQAGIRKFRVVVGAEGERLVAAVRAAKRLRELDVVIASDGKAMKIENYQAAVPSTWNGPRDGNGRRGPYEEALVGTPIADAARPLEALRTLHSFDPCLACAVHTIDAGGREIATVRVL